MESYRVRSISNLTDCIGVGPLPHNQDSIPMELLLWDGRVVTGTYSKKPWDIISPEEIITDSADLIEYVAALLNRGISFVTATALFIVEWTISSVQAPA